MSLFSTNSFLLLGPEESDFFITDVIAKLNISLWSYSISENFPLFCSILAVKSLKRVFGLLQTSHKKGRLRYSKYWDRAIDLSFNSSSNISSFFNIGLHLRCFINNYHRLCSWAINFKFRLILQSKMALICISTASNRLRFSNAEVHERYGITLL